VRFLQECKLPISRMVRVLIDMSKPVRFSLTDSILPNINSHTCNLFRPQEAILLICADSLNAAQVYCINILPSITMLANKEQSPLSDTLHINTAS